MTRRLAAALLLSACVAGAAEPRRNTIGDKPFGLLLLGEGGDRDWKAVVDEARKRSGNGYPLAFAPGNADRKEIQKGLDLLQAQRARAVVIVPLFISSYGRVMDQTRYLLGIREEPAKDPQGSKRLARAGDLLRLKSRVPLVLTKALDDHPLFVELLAARAQTLSRKPAEEAVIFVGRAPESKDELAEWLETAGALAEKVRQKGGFAGARAHALALDGKPADRDASTSALAALVRDLRRQHKVIVVPLAMSSSDVKALRLPKTLDGLFVKYDGRAILPDARIPQWIEASALPASKLPDMRLFKDAGRAGLIPHGITNQPMGAPPALPRQGDPK